MSSDLQALPDIDQADRVSEAGFVLPQVLLAVVILSILAIGAATRLKLAVNEVRLLESAQLADEKLSDAKMAAVYLWVTSSPSADGFDLEGNLSGEASLYLNQNQQRPEDAAKQIWRPDGLAHEYGDLKIAWRDSSGLLSLTSAQPEIVAKFLQETGSSLTESNMLSARLADYQDEDRDRRFSGAERIDYRRIDMAVPLNRPLISHAELSRIKGWDAVMAGPRRFRVLGLTSVTSPAEGVGGPYAHPELIEMGLANLGDSQSREMDLFRSSDDIAIPSDSTRMTLEITQPTPRVLIFDAIRGVENLSAPFTIEPVFHGASVPSFYKDMFPSSAQNIGQSSENDLGISPHQGTLDRAEAVFLKPEPR